jgi:hypothetical protein
MVISKGESAFEVCIRAVEGEWEGRIVEHTLSHMVPILHLRHSWPSPEAALAGVQRRWRRLFPDEPEEERPDFSDALVE